MDVIWLTPVAWLGLVLLAMPVLIHLLTNQQTRHVPFPTLRFLRRTRLAAIRRRAIQNWFLLALRVMLLATAVGALAGPVFVSGSRREEWRTRVVRAVVVTPGTRDADVSSFVEIERRDSFASEEFTPASRVADGLRDAALWLQQQPPAAPEIVVIGSLNLGALGPDDLSLVPAHVGLRFVPVPAGAAGGEVDVYFLESSTRWRARTTLADTGSRVAYEREGDAVEPITVRSSPEDHAVANAALKAVLARGIDMRREQSRRVTVVFEGATPEPRDAPRTKELSPWMRDVLAALPDMTGGAEGDVLVLQTPRPASAPDAAHLLERVARAVFAEDRTSLEPAQISAQTLVRWSRLPRAVEGQPVRDEGDRRWLWGAVLALMAVELWASRARTSAGEAVAVEEARVA